jgi:hypothetical protein
MRTLPVAILLAGITSSALAAKQVTVAQVEQLLSEEQGKPDGAIAQRLAGLQMAERVSTVRLERWEAGLPGNKSREALVALADSSAFLGLPAEEIPTTPMPEHKVLVAIFSSSIDYVVKTVPKLPNFFATRTTVHFEDEPAGDGGSQVIMPSGGGSRSVGRSMIMYNTASTVEYQPLHLVGKSSMEVTYRDGHEVLGGKKSKKEPLPMQGLSTAGEFGPILSLVLADAARGSVMWAHWEQGSRGPEAVFRYKVPQDKSHYAVLFPHGGRVEQELPAYHGEIAIDPASGEILRLTVESDMKAPYQMVEAKILVEYAGVDIGGKTYTCPVRGVAYSKAPVAGNSGSLDTLPPVMRTFVNDVTFEEYHVFRAEAHIVPPKPEE